MQESMETDGSVAEISSDIYDVDWLRIDDFTWQEILLRLDGSNLLRLTETCKRFRDLVSSSTKLIQKIQLVIKFPESGNDIELENRLLHYTQLSRHYQNLEIIRLRDNYLSNDDGKRTNFFNVIRKLAAFVKTLKIEKCHILQNDLVSLLLSFNHLQECSFKNLELFDHVAADDTKFPKLKAVNIKKLQLSECDFFCLVMFKEFNMLESLEITNPTYNRPDVEILEDFLMKQKNLKNLILQDFRFNSTYSTDRLKEVPFQLKSLSLINVCWDIAKHCEVFLKSQKNVEKLKLCRFNRWMTPWESNCIWFMNVMNHFFTSPKLKSVTIDTKYGSYQDLKDAAFLPGIVNKNVVELNYTKLFEDKSELLQIFTRIFPNLKTLTFTANVPVDSSNILQHLQQFKLLESLTLRVSPKLLAHLQLNTATLKGFQYCATNEEKSCEKLTQFFMQNTTIKNLSLNIEPLTVEEITEMLISLAPSLETLNISDLHLNATEAELFATNFQNLRKIRSDFTLAPEIVKILNNGKIIFEAVKAELLFKQDEEVLFSI